MKSLRQWWGFVKFKGTMKKWPVQKNQHIEPHKNTYNTMTQHTFKKNVCVLFMIKYGQYFFICFQMEHNVVYIWKWSSTHALGGVSGVASFITTDEQLQ